MPGLSLGPVVLGFVGDEALGVARIAVAQVIPAGAGPLRHGVGFAGGAVGEIHPVGGLAEQRLGRAAGFVVVERRREQREFALGNGVVMAVLPDDRKRLAPVTLAGEEPVAQLVLDAALAEAVRLQPVDHLRLGFGGGQAVEEAGVDGDAVGSQLQSLQRAFICDRSSGSRSADACDGQSCCNDLRDRQAELRSQTRSPARHARARP